MLLASGMRIGAAAQASGVSPRSLRYYEDEGLIVPGRFSNGYRDYCQSTIDRVAVIRSLLESGLPVRLVRDLLPHLGAETVCSEFVRPGDSVTLQAYPTAGSTFAGWSNSCPPIGAARF